MLRLIVLVVLVVLAVWLIRRAFARSMAKGPSPGPAAGKPGELVKCAHCGLHLPRAEARQIEGLLYCSEEHARLGRR